MSSLAETLQDMLAADAQRRWAQPGTMPAGPEGSEEPAFELRFRLMSAWPREARPAFSVVRGEIESFGYTLSPLHPGADLRHPWVQTELCRVAEGEPRSFAPLVFELEPSGGLRAYVRQFGGHAAPDFPERPIDPAAPVDVTMLADLLRDYVVCTLRMRLPAAA